jgi:hypothetical protein
MQEYLQALGAEAAAPAAQRGALKQRLVAKHLLAAEGLETGVFDQRDSESRGPFQPTTDQVAKPSGRPDDVLKNREAAHLG